MLLVNTVPGRTSFDFSATFGFPVVFCE